MTRTRKSKRKKAGHRSWAPGNAPIKGGHRGDIMSPEKRSSLMSRIRGKGTGPERTVLAALRKKSLVFEEHARDLPSRPDAVFRSARVAVLIDGDFWHGWRFPLWGGKLSPKWREKISANRARDQKNLRSLRKMGWTAVRIWEHQVEQDLDASIARILRALSHTSPAEILSG